MLTPQTGGGGGGGLSGAAIDAAPAAASANLTDHIPASQAGVLVYETPQRLLNASASLAAAAAAAGTDGLVTIQGATAKLQPLSALQTAFGAGGALPLSGYGTVTSVGLVLQQLGWLTVAGSPVVGSGNLTLSRTAAQTAASVLATPATGNGVVGLIPLAKEHLAGAGATASALGAVQLAGDLGGSATAPTVVGINGVALPAGFLVQAPATAAIDTVQASADVVPFTIKRFQAGSASDLQDWKDETGARLAFIDNLGDLVTTTAVFVVPSAGAAGVARLRSDGLKLAKDSAFMFSQGIDTNGTVDTQISRSGIGVVSFDGFTRGDGRGFAIIGSARFLGLTQTAANATTTEYPNSGDCGLHKNTSTGITALIRNDGGAIKSVALT